MVFALVSAVRIAALLAWASLLGIQVARAEDNLFRKLAPVQVFAAPQIAVDPPQPLPEPVSTPSVHSMPDEDQVFTDAPESIPDISYSFSWSPSDTRVWRPGKVSRSSPGLLGGQGALRQWAAPRPVAPLGQSWTLGSENWRYAGEQGLDVTLGSDEIMVPAWGSSARLGGINISQSSLVSAGSTDDNWQYSLSVGALDYSSDDSGDLNLGPTASNSVFRYGVSPVLMLESQLQLAPNLVSSGIGGQYETEWGVWSAGVAQSNGNAYDGWRYQTAYTLDVFDDVKLSWLNERRGAGYADLSRYTADPSVGSVRQKWTATVPLGRWGDVSGVYENERPSAGDARRTFGFTQQFWYSPNLRIGLNAQRELVTGDYDIGIRFSVPIY